MIADMTKVTRNYQLNSIKCASNKTTDWKQELIKEGRSTLGIPVTEAVIFKAEAWLVSVRVIVVRIRHCECSRTMSRCCLWDELCWRLVKVTISFRSNAQFWVQNGLLCMA